MVEYEITEWTGPIPAKRSKGRPKRIDASELVSAAKLLIATSGMSARLASETASKEDWKAAGFNSHLAAIDYIRKHPDLIAAYNTQAK